MLLRKIEGGLGFRHFNDSWISQFQKHSLLCPTPIESTPKVKRYLSLQPQLMCGKLRNEVHLKWVPFDGFHLNSPHFITYKITNLSHPAFSVVFFSFIYVLFVWQFLFILATNLKRYANMSKRVQCYHLRKWARRLLTVVLRQCIFLIDIYIPYISVFNA